MVNDKKPGVKDTLFDRCRRELFRSGFLFPPGGFPMTIKFLCDRIEALEGEVKELKKPHTHSSVEMHGRIGP